MHYIQIFLWCASNCECGRMKMNPCLISFLLQAASCGWKNKTWSEWTEIWCGSWLELWLEQRMDHKLVFSIFLKSWLCLIYWKGMMPPAFLWVSMSSTIYDYLCTSMVRRLALFLEFNSKSLNSLIPCGVARWWALLWLYLFSVPISADYSYLQLSIFIIYTLLQGLIKTKEITLHKNCQFSTLLNINVVYYVVQVWI